MYVIAMVKNMVIRLVLGLDSRQPAAVQDCSVISHVDLELAESWTFFGDVYPKF